MLSLMKVTLVGGPEAANNEKWVQTSGMGLSIRVPAGKLFSNLVEVPRFAGELLDVSRYLSNACILLFTKSSCLTDQQSFVQNQLNTVRAKITAEIRRGKLLGLNRSMHYARPGQ